jgi:hypothetical protein
MARQLARRRGHPVEVDTDPVDDGYGEEPNDEAEQGGGRRGEHGMNRDGSHRAGGRSSRSPERASKRETRRPSRSGRDRSSNVVQRGWEASRANRAKTGSFNNLDQLTIPIAPKSVTIAFLEEEPFFTFNQHWVNEITNGRKSFVCLGDDNDCPLCLIGLGRRN